MIFLYGNDHAEYTRNVNLQKTKVNATKQQGICGCEWLAGWPAGRQAGRRAGGRAGRQAGRQVGRQAGSYRVNSITGMYTC